MNAVREPIGLFTLEQAAELAQVSVRRLRYWDKTGVYSPTHVEKERRTHGRLYTFRDLVALRTLASLRKITSLQALRTLGHKLKERHKEPWSRLTFYTDGDHIIFMDSPTGAMVATRPLGQTVMNIDLERIATDMTQAVERARQRQPGDKGQVRTYRNVMQSAPVLAGTRIPTSAIWSFHAAGYDADAILREYPSLTKDDIQAAIDYEEARGRKRAG